MTELIIHHIDVGQGDSTLIILKDQPIMSENMIAADLVIDTGALRSEILFAALIDFGANPEAGEEVYNFAERKLQEIEGVRKCKKLDAIILSHFDRDHTWGARKFISLESKLKKVCDHKTILIVPTLDGEGKTWSGEFAKILKAKMHIEAEAGLVINNINGFHFKCLASDKNVSKDIIMESSDEEVDAEDRDSSCSDALEDETVRITPSDLKYKHRKPATATPANAISIAWHIQHGYTPNSFNYYTAGDLTTGAEKQIAGKVKDFKFDAIKLSHHGSHGSTPKELAEHINPKGAAFITPGRISRYSHPHIETLEKLNVQIFCTGRLDEFGLMSSNPAESESGKRNPPAEWTKDGSKGVFEPETLTGKDSQKVGTYSLRKLKRIPRLYCASAVSLTHKIGEPGYTVSQDVFQPQDLGTIQEYIRASTTGWLTPPLVFVGVDYIRQASKYHIMHQIGRAHV